MQQIFHQQVSDGKIPLHGSYMHYVLKRSGISVAVAYKNESEHYSINGGIGEVHWLFHNFNCFFSEEDLDEIVKLIRKILCLLLQCTTKLHML